MTEVISGQPGTVRLAGPTGRWVLAATVLGSSMAMLDATVVNVALPTIGKDLHTSLAGLQWTVTAYTLTMAGLILLGGALGDRLGRRRIFLTGVAWFALASALCGLAPNIGVLIAAGAVLAALTIDNDVLRPTAGVPVPEPACRTCCPVGAPPLEPSEPARAEAAGH